MVAPLVLVVLVAVTVRAALFRSSLAGLISERVEVASPLNAWKRGEAYGGGRGWGLVVLKGHLQELGRLEALSLCGASLSSTRRPREPWSGRDRAGFLPWERYIGVKDALAALARCILTY